MSLETLEKIIESGTKLTPMMEQYYGIKKNYIDCIVFFRMGDFYEVFFEDAKKTTKVLNIALTHRGKLGDTPIPMAGIPHHAATTYIDRITAHGIKVAICEQVEDPKEAKGIVKRAVTQVVSPGIPYDLDKTEGGENHFIASAFKEGDSFYFSALDFTTGEFWGSELESKEELFEKLRSLSPKEFIAFKGQWENLPEVATLLEQMGTLKTTLAEDYFNYKFTEIYVERLLPSFKRDKVVKKSWPVAHAVGAISYYVNSTQDLEDFFHIRPFRMISDKGHLRVTLPTLVGLEIFPKSRETYKDSLVGFLDKTKTAMGARKLKKLFASPLRDKEEIELRQGLIRFFLDHFDLLEEIREELNLIRDLERILAKISTGKANASDLINIKTGITTFFDIEKKLKSLKSPIFKPLSKKISEQLKELASKIEKTINDEIGASLDKGNLIKPRCHKERDRLASLSQNASGELLTLEERYREETGILKLKVKSNNVAGFFIEVSKTHLDKIPKHFERRQTLVNSERYMTEELKEFEKDMISAKEKLERLEREIFKAIISDVSEISHEILELAEKIALIDSFQGLAWVSYQEEFVCPSFSKEKGVELKGAWHPLIKSAIKDQFVPHNLSLDEKQFFGLITGPNMAGKTTVMREVAIIQLMAQVGSFVPASVAELSICDYLFSRLGASDDILKGQSTFMVEMSETAEIISHATENSLIILDEVGRGTSTYDGLSIAWSLVEHFIEKTRAVTLFATHYHELIDLIDMSPCAKNLTVETYNKNGQVQFLYNLIEEAASQSYGIYVAKLAGLPKTILQRSQTILKDLEKNHDQNIVINTNQLDLFGEEKPDNGPELPTHLQKLEEELEDLDILNMTPLKALQKLQDFKDLIQ